VYKWLAVAALIYGLIAAAAIVAPRTMLTVAALDLAALGQDWRESGPPIPFYDFEAPGPLPLTRPEGSAEVVPVGGGNHVLRWEPPADVPLAFLGLPLSAPEPTTEALAVRLRSEPPAQLIVGLREEDGSAYITELPAGPDWQTHLIPLADMQPAPRTQDENGQLDVDQVTAVFIARGEPRGPRQRRRGREALPPPQQQPLVIELDDLGFAPPQAGGEEGFIPPPPPDGRHDGPPPDGRPPGDQQGRPSGERRGPPRR
jgi:hypothetical protein